MFLQPAMRYHSRGKYRTADTACFSKIPKNTATALFGAVLCGVVFTFFLHSFGTSYKISQKFCKTIAKYRRYHRYRDRKRVVHQVKYMTFSRRYCRYRRCRMFFLPVSYIFGAFCCFFLHNTATEPHTELSVFAIQLSQT